MNRRRPFSIIFVLLFFGSIYASISLVNHWFFRTAALDLGLYTNAAWKYAHFELPDRSLFLDNSDPLLADHFDLHLILWSPLIHLFGSWTLLIVQIAAVLLGGYGVYRYVHSFDKDQVQATMAAAIGLGSFGVFSALSFDFHSSVIVAMALPWYLLAVKEGRTHHSWMILIFMLIGKENIGLWLGIVAIAAIALPRKMSAKALLAQSMASFGWSALVIGLIMPALDGSKTYAHFDYQVLGNTPGEALGSILAHPSEAFRALFEDVRGTHYLGTAIKLEFYFILLASGGWAFFRGWPFILMALPIIAQKMWHDDPAKWGLFGHYSIEFSMLLPLAVMAVVRTHEKRSTRLLVFSGALFLTLACTLHTLEFPLEHKPNEHGYHDRSRFYQPRHYERNYDLTPLRETIRAIPDGAAVSAQTHLVPHLIDRSHLFQFPIINNSEYILLAPNETFYPLSREDWESEVNRLRSDPGWSTLVDDPAVILFQRTDPVDQ